MSRTSSLPRRLQPMLATLIEAPFDKAGWVFEDKYDGFRMVAKIEDGKVALYSRNGNVISYIYIEVAKALEGVKGDAVIRRRTGGNRSGWCFTFPTVAECASSGSEAALLRL